MSTTQPKENVFNRVLGLISNKLSDKIKRMIFMSSIYGVIQQVKDPDMVLVQQLNDVLKLSHYSEAFQLPIRVKSLIWDDCKSGFVDTGLDSISFSDLRTKEKVTDDQCLGVARYFCHRAPRWLRYATPEFMEGDVVRLIQRVRHDYVNGKKKHPLA